MKKDNRRIANNTIILYIRMIVVMFIGLFTSRIILNRLGVIDFGIFNVIAGLVMIMGFVNQALTCATQRYITFNLAQNKKDVSNKIFNLSLFLHITIAIVVLIIGESVGQFFLQTMMVIPSEKINAASIVLLLSLFVAFISISLVPFNAEIIAHEDLRFYAFVSIFETFLKLVCVLSLYLFEDNRLIVYSTLILLNQSIVAIIIIYYCKRRYEEVFIKISKDLTLYKEIFAFSFWSLIGDLAWTLTIHGTNVLLNLFFNPAVNAARGIAVQVQGAVSGLANNLNMAINPQITKNYSINDLQRVHNLLLVSSKLSFFLILIPSLPIYFEASFILELWLGVVPEHTVNFVKLTLILVLIESIGSPFNASIFATGRVKYYQLTIGCCNLLNIPIAYCVFKYFKQEPELVYVIVATTTFINQMFKLFYIKKYLKLRLYSFIKAVYVPCVSVFIICFLLFSNIHDKSFFNNSFANIIINIACSFFIVFFIGLKSQEKKMLLALIKKKILFIHNS